MNSDIISEQALDIYFDYLLVKPGEFSGDSLYSEN